MVTNDKLPPGGVYFWKKIATSGGALPAAVTIGRWQPKILPIGRAPSTFKYYLKVNGVWTIFVGVIESKKSSVGHRPVAGLPPDDVLFNRTIDFGRNPPSDVSGVLADAARAPYGAKNVTIWWTIAARSLSDQKLQSGDQNILSSGDRSISCQNFKFKMKAVKWF